MSKEANAAAQKRFGEAVNSGRLNDLHEVIAPHVVDHDPAPGQESGPEGFIAFFTTMRTAFPDLAIAVEQQVADEEQIAFAYTITGTHRGDFMGIPPSGRAISARGVQISRFEDGKLVERWGSSDELGILKQLGVEPAQAG